MKDNRHRLPTKRERFEEAKKKLFFVLKDALDESAASGNAVNAAKIVQIKSEIERQFKQLAPLIQQEPEDTEEKGNLFLM